MRAEAALLDAYAEWRRLASAANVAIRGRNWAFVLECHRVIEQLQPVITRLTSETASEWRQSKADTLTVRKKIRLAVLELIKLVESNKSLLKSVWERVESEYQQRQQADRNLKRLQQSYAVGQRAAWSSIS